MANRILLILLLITNFACNSGKQNKEDNYPNNFTAKVIGVKDGDTIEVLYNKVPIVIRLEHIDCPERKQPFGNKAKQFTSDFIFGHNARIVSNGKKDRWGRLIAEVYNDKDENLNKAIVENGLGMHFKRYSSDMSYDELETIAKNQKRGMWSQPKVIEPWIYRKN